MRRVLIAVGVVVAAATAYAGYAVASSSSDPAAMCDPPSYDGTNLTLHCVVPQVTNTATVTQTDTATETATVTATETQTQTETATVTQTVPGPTITQTATVTVPPPPPDPRTTAGVQPGHTLTTITTSPYVVTGPISDKHFTGDLYVAGTGGYTISNVQVDGTVIVANDYGHNGYVSDVTLSHVDLRVLNTIGFIGLTIDAANIHGAVNAAMTQIFDYSVNGPHTRETIPARHLTISNSWFHGLGSFTNAAHTETVHTSGVQGARIFNNYFDITAPDSNTVNHVSANFFEEPQLYQTYDQDFLIYGNTFVNGGYYLASIEPTGASAVCNNRFESTAADPLFDGTPERVNMDPKLSSRAPTGGFPAVYQSGNTLNGQPVVFATGAGSPPAAPPECAQ